MNRSIDTLVLDYETAENMRAIGITDYPEIGQVAEKIEM